MRQWTVDAFAAAPFKGNPACVVEPFEAWPEARWMQALAAENNQAETAFLLKTADPARFGLRWFTPAVEVPLCGHATLASSHVLLNELGVQAAEIAFETLKSGVLTVRRTEAGIEMDFPADPPRRTVEPEGLAEALGVKPAEVWVGQYLIAVLDSEETLRALTPNLSKLEPIGAEASAGCGNVSVVATADAGRPYQVVSRFFAPGSGIPEDPTTGSAHCMLAPLYAEKLGRPAFRCHQAYPGRGGDLEVELKGARVLLRGQAVTVVESRLRV
ncbi:PhzF family phenazine biosynthesis protein [Phenylobacterium montanum]|uniref:PhzF family phenazine biosynthesis protein n=1 Tax=Phenylobacterium montanum TaxID=2823693 RepID=A0A975FY63_9CAUL|nr:PhzF family phenazine biosynthesis protein [Caulobacter sp. S6]QUD87097.1 PhzF family phenazine biosynthesis protein [Caulobacter sp. S6]